MKPYSILTLSKFPDHLDRCLSSLFVSQPDLSMSDVFVVDDGLPAETKKRWQVNYIPGQQPFIFARNFNLGMSAIEKNKDLFFIGDDGAMLTPNGTDTLSNHIKELPAIGILSPVIAGPVKNFFQWEGVLESGIAKGNDLANLPGYYPTIIFVAVYIKRAALDAVGPLPEKLHGYGYEDDYFSAKMKQLNFDWAIDPSVVVRHGFGKFRGASSYKRSGLDPVKMMEVNRKIYEELMNNE